MVLSGTPGTEPPPAPGVVFDLGNVLIEWDPHPAIAAGLGDAEASRFLGAGDFDFHAWNHAQDAGRGWDDAEAEVVRTHPHWAEHARSYRVHFGASLIGEIEGTVRILCDLHEARVPLLALTNWSHDLFPQALERFDFLGLFDDIVVSGTEGAAKPDPAIFERLAERAGRPLDAWVFVDDKPGNVEAAAACGLDGIVYRGPGPLREELRSRGLPV